jgi:hypothetical protein
MDHASRRVTAYITVVKTTTGVKMLRGYVRSVPMSGKPEINVSGKRTATETTINRRPVATLSRSLQLQGVVDWGFIIFPLECKIFGIGALVRISGQLRDSLLNEFGIRLQVTFPTVHCHH